MRPAGALGRTGGTDGKFPLFYKSPIIISKTSLFKQYGKTFRLSLSSLIDPSGKVRWVNLTENFVVRARPEEALAAFDAMNKSSQSGQ